MLKKVEDMGMTPKGTTKRRYFLVECSGCKKQYKIQASHYTTRRDKYCKECSIKDNRF